MVEKKNKKDVIAEALSDIENIKNSIKAESKNTISTLLKEEVKNVLRESIEDDEDEYEVQDPASEEGGEDNGIENTDSTDEPVDGSDEVSTDDAPESSEEPAEGEESGEGEEVSDDENADEWSEFDKFKVDDDTYDLTGEEDYDTVVKVYKLLKNDDNVVVKKDGDKITLKDNENDAEYVIDLGDEEESQDEGESFNDSEELEQECKSLKESKAKSNIKKPKTMKENKELVFEVDLGYTDNYQSKDPIQGLSNNEPSKYKTLDAGVPTGTKKPWAGNAKSEGDPYGEKTIEEEDKPIDATTEEDPKNPKFDSLIPDEQVEEGKDRTLPKKRHMVKSDSGNNPGKTPEVGHVTSKEGQYVGQTNEDVIKANKKMMESLIAKAEAVIAENKALKNTIKQTRDTLKETLLLTVNLGKVTKLFMENTTSKSEKADILNRFSEAKTIEQSNMLYESINRELQAKNKTITLEGKSLTTDGSAINETKVYETEGLKDVKDMMRRMMNC